MNYNAADIIGKTLQAVQSVLLKRIPSDTAPVIYTVAPGQSVGVVYSYIAPGSNNKRLYWMFKDANGKTYYAEHSEGRFSISALKDQGVPSTKDNTAAAAKPEGVMSFIERNIKTIAYVAGGAFVLKEVLPSLLGKKSK